MKIMSIEQKDAFMMGYCLRHYVQRHPEWVLRENSVSGQVVLDTGTDRPLLVIDHFKNAGELELALQSLE